MPYDSFWWAVFEWGSAIDLTLSVIGVASTDDHFVRPFEPMVAAIASGDSVSFAFGHHLHLLNVLEPWNNELALVERSHLMHMVMILVVPYYKQKYRMKSKNRMNCVHQMPMGKLTQIVNVVVVSPACALRLLLVLHFHDAEPSVLDALEPKKRRKFHARNISGIFLQIRSKIHCNVLYIPAIGFLKLSSNTSQILSVFTASSNGCFSSRSTWTSRKYSNSINFFAMWCGKPIGTVEFVKHISK